MADYIQLPLVTDGQTLAQQAYDYIQTQIPGWTPKPGNLEVIVVEALTELIAENRIVASDVPPVIFKYFGTLIGRPAIAARQSTAVSTWTLRDNNGYTIDAGSVTVSVAGTEGPVAFTNDDDIVVPPGDTTAPSVNLTSILEGADTAGLGGTVELVSAPDFLSTVVFVGTSTGGTDNEDDSTYVDRISEELQLLSPRLIKPEHFAIRAKGTAGIYRALAIDLWNPNTLTFGNRKTVSVAVVQEDGEIVADSDIRDAVLADLLAQREWGFLAFIIDPTYTTIDVQFTIEIQDGSDPESTRLAAEGAVKDYLRPSNWGLDPKDTSRSWRGGQDRVYYLELTTLINNIDGVERITSFGMRKGADAYGTSNILLSGVAPLTRFGSVVGTLA